MLITVDGLDGSGKTSSIKKLVEWCNDNGIKATSVVEPGTTPLGLHIRQFHLEHSNTITPMTQVHLMLAARCENAQHIKKLLEEYDVVIVDRWLHSTLVYQYISHLDYWKDEDTFDWIVDEHHKVVGDLVPDRMFYLAVPHDLRRSRLEARGELYELDKATFTEDRDAMGRECAEMLAMTIFEHDVTFVEDTKRYLKHNAR